VACHGKLCAYYYILYLNLKFNNHFSMIIITIYKKGGENKILIRVGEMMKGITNVRV
jgi:hypothetical protein